MKAWPQRVRADVAASAPEPPELPKRRRILGHAVLLTNRPGTPDGLTDSSVRSLEEAERETEKWNRILVAGRAVVVEFREVPC